jgi:hypothetical protein
VCIVLIALLAGCASSGPPGQLPFGEWVGQGTFIYETWSTDEDHQPVSLHRTYPTTLTIEPTQVEGTEAVHLEIVSDRGPMPHMNDRTHIKLDLVEAKRVSDSAVLYRAVGSALDLGKEPSKDFVSRSAPFTASCVTTEGETVFQIQYMDNFVDTIRFRGRRAQKSGVYFDTKSGLVHWSEHLTRSN